jgi:hypothetical protein
MKPPEGGISSTQELPGPIRVDDEDQPNLSKEMNSYRHMLAVAGLLVGILPASEQTPPPRGSDAVPPVSGSKEGTSATQAGDAKSATTRGSESSPNATGPGGIEIPTDATSDGAKAAPQGPDNGGTLSPRAPSNAR